MGARRSVLRIVMSRKLPIARLATIWGAELSGYLVEGQAQPAGRDAIHHGRCNHDRVAIRCHDLGAGSRAGDLQSGRQELLGQYARIGHTVEVGRRHVSLVDGACGRTWGDPRGSTPVHGMGESPSETWLCDDPVRLELRAWNLAMPLCDNPERTCPRRPEVARSSP